eukprot:gb/GFBE01041645.1/.p1 GENE.gb/GFBE01041645.1/~~gb/GFBE01041645.1/.p1  ORF type:complete len:429 (+),score=74.42 gb/GFBE01041645.1/:1-1287(+)
MASAAVYQQSSKARALDLARLAAGAGRSGSRLGRSGTAGLEELWPGLEELMVQDPAAEISGGGGSSGSRAAPTPASLTTSIFTNDQLLADHWLDVELQQKLQAGTESSALHRARLLKSWIADVQEAAALELADDSPAAAGDVHCLPASWLWAALAPASGDPAVWKAALLRLMAADPSRPGGAADSVHHAVLAALALGKVDEAVRLYLAAEFFADALLLARLRLPARHPLVAYVYSQWGADLKRRGRHDQAAGCHLASGKLGAALADLEDWLPTARPQLGPDPVRLAGSFAAACVAAALATAHLRPAAEAKHLGIDSRADGPATPSETEDDNDCDASLAFDHRRWWGRPELRAAVQAWKRCIIEALHSGRVTAALSLARVGPLKKRAPSEGERFLRGALAGYASAISWWQVLHQESMPELEADKADDEA